jgi:hypothetical protein
VATPPTSSAAPRDRLHVAEQKSLGDQNANFKARWNWQNARSRARAARGKKNLRRRFNPQK